MSVAFFKQPDHSLLYGKDDSAKFSLLPKARREPHRIFLWPSERKRNKSDKNGNSPPNTATRTVDKSE
jgi:hypothetical protein